MDKQLMDQVFEFNRLYKRYDDIYRRAAKRIDLPELDLWVLYVLRQRPGCTQKDLVDSLSHPKQSIHSALRRLEERGYAARVCAPDDRRSRCLCLTEKGRALAERTVDKIIEAEQRAYKCLTAPERDTLLRLMAELDDAMDRVMKDIT